jgi:hypothetical protein
VASGYLTALAESGVRHTVLRRLRRVSRTADSIVATLGVDGSNWTESRTVDAVVAEVGTEPVTDVYDALLPTS